MRKTCNRRRVNPAAHPVAFALLGKGPLGGAQVRDMRLVELEAIDALAAGTASSACAGQLKLLALTAQHLARAGIGPEVAPLASEVLAFPLTVTAGLYSATPAQVNTLRELFELHDQQRTMATRADYARARVAARG